MAKDKGLKAALERHKGVDHKKDRQKRLQKEAEKRKRSKRESKIDVGALEDAVAGNEEESEAGELANDPEELLGEEVAAEIARLAEKANGQADGWETDDSEDAEEDDDGDDEEGGVTLETFEDESESDSDEDETFYTAAGGSPEKRAQPNGAAEEDEEEDEEDIPLSDIESLASDEKGDVIPHQRLTINNTTALNRSLKSFALPSSLPFSANQTITSAEPVQIQDVEDDLSRELAFYKQSLDAVKEARAKLKKEGVPFTRPADYFAEMVKSEEQMGKVRAKMVDETARKKASADARRQRDLKKFGKAVQVAKLQERDKAKRETLDKIGALKRSKSLSSSRSCDSSLMCTSRTTKWRHAHDKRRRSLRRRARRRSGDGQEGPRCSQGRWEQRWWSGTWWGRCGQEAPEEGRKVRLWWQEAVCKE